MLELDDSGRLYRKLKEEAQQREEWRCQAILTCLEGREPEQEDSSVTEQRLLFYLTGLTIAASSFSS